MNYPDSYRSLTNNERQMLWNRVQGSISESELSPRMSPYTTTTPLTIKRSLFSREYAVALLLIILLSGGTSVFAAADNSLPTSPLYPIKISVTEPVQGILHTTPASRAQWSIEKTARRLDETRQLIENHALTPEIASNISSLIQEHTDDARENISALARTDSTQGAVISLSLVETIEKKQEEIIIANAEAQSVFLALQDPAPQATSPDSSPQYSNPSPALSTDDSIETAPAELSQNSTRALEAPNPDTLPLVEKPSSTLDTQQATSKSAISTLSENIDSSALIVLNLTDSIQTAATELAAEISKGTTLAQENTRPSLSSIITGSKISPDTIETPTDKVADESEKTAKESTNLNVVTFSLVMGDIQSKISEIEKSKVIAERTEITPMLSTAPITDTNTTTEIVSPSIIPPQESSVATKEVSPSAPSLVEKSTITPISNRELANLEPLSALPEKSKTSSLSTAQSIDSTARRDRASNEEQKLTTETPVPATNNTVPEGSAPINTSPVDVTTTGTIDSNNVSPTTTPDLPKKPLEETTSKLFWDLRDRFDTLKLITNPTDADIQEAHSIRQQLEKISVNAKKAATYKNLLKKTDTPIKNDTIKTETDTSNSAQSQITPTTPPTTVKEKIQNIISE